MANFRENLRLSEFVDLFMLSCSSITPVCSKTRDGQCVSYAKFMANFRENLRLSEFRVVQSLWSVQRPERDSVYHMPNSWLISEKISGYLSSLICLC